MSLPLHIILIDRAPAALESLNAVAQQLGFNVDWSFAGSEAELQELLHDERLDAALAAYPPARLDAQQLIDTVRAAQPGLPFIWLADALTEEVVDLCLDNAATDYILRGQPARLAPALARTLRCPARPLSGGHHNGRCASETEPDQMPNAMPALDDQRCRFMSILSHEFRTPLSVIMTSAELLNRYADRLPPARKQIYFDAIRHQVHNLNDILDDISIFMRAEMGRLEFKPESTDLDALCQAMVTKMQAEVGASHTIDFQTEGSFAELWLDPALLEHALRNLLANAIKYSPQGGPVHVWLRRDGQEIVLDVTDHGLGIPEADLPHLFKPYFRGSNAQKIGGTGLGLRIVRAAAELHGGMVVVNSQEGSGTTFSLRLPQRLAITADQR